MTTYTCEDCGNQWPHETLPVGTECDCGGWFGNDDLRDMWEENEAANSQGWPA